MLATAMLGLTVLAEAEGDEVAALTVTSASVVFGDTVYLRVAVKADSSDGLKLTITNNALAESDANRVVTLDPDTSIEDAPEGTVAFTYSDLGAKNMGDVLTLQASQNSATGAAITYSILEYALKAENELDANLTALVKAMINYGAKAQVAFGHLTDATVDTDYVYALQDSSKKLIDYSLVRFIGNGSFTDANGEAVTKAIMAPGDTLTGLQHTGTGAADTDIWYNTAMQRRGTSAESSVPYTSGNQSIFVVPASVANSAENELDMDTFTGSGYRTSSERSGDQSSWFGGSFVSESAGRLEFEPGYIKWNPGTGINFNSSYPTRAAYESVGAYAAASIAGTSTEGLCGKLTISITMAADGNGKAPISRFHLRTNKNKTIDTGNAATASADNFATAGRLSLFQASGTTLRVVYNNAASGTTSTGNIIVTLPTVADEGKPADFVTIHMVITIDGTGTCPMCKGAGTVSDADCASCVDGNANTIEYYVNDDTTPVTTVINPVPMNYWTYFKNGTAWRGYFNGEPGSYSGYLKSFVVTKGNITEYFK